VALDSVRRFIRDADALRSRSEQAPGLLWSSQVNRRFGAMIALALLETQVTPNMVTVASLLTHVLGAAIVVTSTAPASIAIAVLVFVIWQLAFAMDCTDGQLARARGTTSSFGAWLDQVFDHFAHVAVIASLVIFAVRGLGLGPTESAALGSLAVGGNLISFAAAQRNAILGTRPAIDPQGSGRLRWLLHARQVTDHGSFVALASLGLLFPTFLLAVLIFSSAATAAVVLGQVALNWIAQLRMASGSAAPTVGLTPDPVPEERASRDG
jgi:phosphatidylglycerophosphate synthase